MNDVPAAVYVIADDDGMRDALVLLFEVEGLRVVTRGSASEFLVGAELYARGCIVAEIRTLRRSGSELLKKPRDVDGGLPVLVPTRPGDVPMAIEALREGAVAFLEMPFNSDQSVATVRSAIAHRDRSS
jgi:FixJ family two-component response regulator